MEVKHTLSDVLKRLVVDIDNMNSFLYSLEDVLESKSENVNVSQTNSDGSTYSINVPSFGYLKGKIEDINTRFETLLSTNSDVIGIKSANGDVRKFELKKTSQLLQELESISTASFTLPTEFGVKNNWFFESFLNPLLYVSLDISGVLTDDIDSFVVKRLIVNSVNNDDIEAVVSAWRSDWLTTGPLVEEFESVLEQVVGASCISVSSGTAALHFAYKAIGIGPGD